MLENKLNINNDEDASKKAAVDWWDSLSDGAKSSIELGLKDAMEGKLTPNEEVMKKYRKWLA
jgi:hypothetical protein